jgi:putative transposase
MDLGERAGWFKFLIRDQASRFTTASEGVFAGNGTRVIKAPGPVAAGEQVLAEFARHYNGHRPHQSLQQEPPRGPCRAIDITAWIERRQVLGGLISEYRPAA